MLVLGFVACDPDDGPDPVPVVQPTSSNLTLTIDHKLGTEDMVYNEEVTLPSNESVEVKRISYLLGDFYLIDNAGNTVLLDDQYVLIDAHKGRTTFMLEDIPFGDYKSIGFSIGLDSSTNHGDPSQYGADHPLSPINNSLHWNWTGGYIFTALEGRMVPSGETFIFHLAGAQNRLDFELDASFTLSAAEAAREATITYDVNEIFINPEIYNIAQDGASSHSTTSAVTMKLIANMQDVMSNFTVTK